MMEETQRTHGCRRIVRPEDLSELSAYVVCDDNDDLIF